MAQDKYFDKFPIVQYGNSASNNTVVDITKRVTFLDVVYNNPYVFYPYDLTDFERPDQFSYRYYNDQYKSWILYLSNKITDPYYGWYLPQDEFDNFVIAKYGSVDLASSKIKYYVNNWPDQENISTSRYNSLTPGQQSYWQPVYGFNNNIMSYSAKQIDWTVTTNQMVSYSVGNTNFNIDEIVNVVFDNNDTGQGQVVAAANGVLYIQHTSGTTLANGGVTIANTSYIYGTESNVNTIFTSASLITTTIDPAEQTYWVPVTYYDYENQKNEYNKTIQVLDSTYSTVIVNNIKTLLSNT